MTPMTVVQINRDPFTRSSLMRVKAEAGAACSWCGSPARWRYYHEPDSRHVNPPSSGPAFCGVDCWRTYFK